MREIARITLLVVITVLILGVLYRIQEAVVLFLLSLAFAAAVRPLTVQLTARGLPRGLALTTVYFLTVAGLSLLIFLLGRGLVQEIPRIGHDLVLRYELFAPRLANGSTFEQMLSRQLPPPEQLVTQIAGDEGGVLLTALLGFTAGLLGLISSAAIILILSIYWSIDHLHFERLWLSLLPGMARRRARETWRSIEQGVGGYIRSQAVQTVLVALLLFVGYRLLGIRYPTVITLLGTLASLVPLVGVVLALGPPLTIGLLTNPLSGALAAVYTLAVFIFLEMWLEPHLFNRRQYSSFITVLAIMLLADSYGLVGIIFAPVISITLQITAHHLAGQSVRSSVSTVGGPAVAANQATRFYELQERLATVRQEVAAWEGSAPPELTNMLQRLEKLVANSASVLDQPPTELAEEGRRLP